MFTAGIIWMTINSHTLSIPSHKHTRPVTTNSQESTLSQTWLMVPFPNWLLMHLICAQFFRCVSTDWESAACCSGGGGRAFCLPHLNALTWMDNHMTWGWNDTGGLGGRMHPNLCAKQGPKKKKKKSSSQIVLHRNPTGDWTFHKTSYFMSENSSIATCLGTGQSLHTYVPVTKQKNGLQKICICPHNSVSRAEYLIYRGAAQGQIVKITLSRNHTGTEQASRWCCPVT